MCVQRRSSAGRSNSTRHAWAADTLVSRNALAVRLERLEERRTLVSGCPRCGDQRLIILAANEEPDARFIGDACRGCGRPTTLLRCIDCNLV